MFTFLCVSSDEWRCGEWWRFLIKTYTIQYGWRRLHGVWGGRRAISTNYGVRTMHSHSQIKYTHSKLSSPLRRFARRMLARTFVLFISSLRSTCWHAPSPETQLNYVLVARRRRRRRTQHDTWTACRFCVCICALISAIMYGMISKAFAQQDDRQIRVRGIAVYASNVLNSMYWRQRVCTCFRYINHALGVQ